MGRTPAKAWLAAAALGLAGSAGAQPSPVPPPAEQQTADCAAPVFATDQLVCSDPALHALDSELAAQLAEAPEPSSRWIEPQRQWFSRRSRCAFAEDHGACAEAAYRERLALFAPLSAEAEMLAANCGVPEIASVVVKGKQTILLGRDGKIQGTAWNSAAKSSWLPYLTAAWRGRQVVIRTLADDNLKCRTKRL
jgi:uncharacterized protein